MAPLSSPSSRRTPRSRGRPSGSKARGVKGSGATISTNGTPETPLKKRRYVPGGPGGGGRYIEVDGTEIPVGGTGPGGYNYSGPRGRIGRENVANGMTMTPRTHPRRSQQKVGSVSTARPRYSSAAAAAAAVVQSDGYKP